MNQKYSDKQLAGFSAQARRDPHVTKGWPRALVAAVIDWQKRQTMPKPGAPGGRQSMTLKQRSAYISEHGQAAYLALPR